MRRVTVWGVLLITAARRGSPRVKSNDNNCWKVASVERKEDHWHRGARRAPVEVNAGPMAQREWERKQEAVSAGRPRFQLEQESEENVWSLGIERTSLVTDCGFWGQSGRVWDIGLSALCGGGRRVTMFACLHAWRFRPYRPCGVKGVMAGSCWFWRPQTYCRHMCWEGGLGGRESFQDILQLGTPHPTATVNNENLEK